MKRYIHIKTLVLAWLLVFLGNSVFAQDLKSRIPFDTSVTTGVLANGLRFYIKPNGKPENKVELRLAINAGSILENDNQQGLAHFMEHMNFNGTQHYPKNDLVDFLQSIGVEFGADLNAYTGFDETVFILPIPTDKPGNLDKGFEVLSDWAQKALITDKDVDDERKVVLEESRLGKGAEDRMRKIYLPYLLANSQYAKRLPIGKEDILKNCNPELIRQFYKDWYRPNLMAVAVVGDVTVAAAKALIEKYFAPLTNPSNAPERKLFPVAPYKKKMALVLTDKEATSTDFTLVFSSKPTKPDVLVGDYRQTIIKNLFVQILNNRLRELTQTATPPYLYSYAGISGWARGYESFQLSASASGDVKTAINAAIGELVRIQKFGFNPSEMDVAKKSTLSWVERLYNERNTNESGNIIEEYLRNFLTQEPMPGIAIDYSYYVNFMPTITLAEINAEAKKWLGDNKNYFTMVQGPEDLKSTNLTNAGLLKMVAAAYKQKVSPKVEKALATSLLSKEPTPGKIVSESKDELLGTTTYTLSNGVKVTIKPTDFKSDEIIFSGYKKGGLGNYSPKNKMNAAMMSQIIASMGYGDFNPTDLKNFLSGKTSAINTAQSAVNNVVNGSSSVKDLETMLQLNYLKLTNPRKDLDLFAGFINKQKAYLENAKSNPQTAFFDTFNKALYAGNPYAPITIPTHDDLALLNADSILMFYKNAFSNADGFHFFFTGNVDANSIKPLIEKYIASLPVSGTEPVYRDNGLRPISGEHELTVNIGTEPQSLILMNYFGDANYSENLALRAGLMTEILNIKIIEELREKIGGIYSGGIYANVEKDPYNHFGIMVYLPCGPESVDTLLIAMRAEIAKIMKDGPSDKDLAKVKIAKIEAYKEQIKTNAYWNSQLKGIYYDGKDKQQILHYEKIVENITAAQIQETAQFLLNTPNQFLGILYPQK